MCLESFTQQIKTHAAMLHFKLKYKEIYRSIYNIPHHLVFFLFFPLHSNPAFKCYETGAWKLEYTRLCHQWKLSVNSTKHTSKGVQLLSESRIIVETGVAVEVSACRCLCSGPWTNLCLWLHLISLSDNLGVISWQKRARSQGALESDIKRDKDRAWEKIGEEMDFFSNYARKRDFVKIKLGDTRAYWGTHSL